MIALTRQVSTPQVFFNDRHVGDSCQHILRILFDWRKTYGGIKEGSNADVLDQADPVDPRLHLPSKTYSSSTGRQPQHQVRKTTNRSEADCHQERAIERNTTPSPAKHIVFDTAKNSQFIEKNAKTKTLPDKLLNEKESNTIVWTAHTDKDGKTSPGGFFSQTVLRLPNGLEISVVAITRQMIGLLPRKAITSDTGVTYLRSFYGRDCIGLFQDWLGVPSLSAASAFGDVLVKKKIISTLVPSGTNQSSKSRRKADSVFDQDAIYRLQALDRPELLNTYCKAVIEPQDPTLFMYELGHLMDAIYHEQHDQLQQQQQQQQRWPKGPKKLPATTQIASSEAGLERSILSSESYSPPVIAMSEATKQSQLTT